MRLRYATAPRRQWVPLTALACLIFLLLVYWQLPASLLLRYLDLRSLQGSPVASGTLWQGSLRQVAWPGVPVNEVRWTLSPWYALSGHLRGRVSARGPSTAASATFRFTLDGNGELTAAQGRLPLAALQPTARAPWQGGVEWGSSRLQFSHWRPTAHAGWVEVHDLRAPTATATLGSFRADWDHLEDTQGRVRELSGALKLRGSLQRLPLGGYQLHVEVRPQPAATPVQIATLAMFGPADATGLRTATLEFGH